MEIKELTLEVIDQWYDFFENRAFVDNGEWRGCYCTACFYPKPPEYPNTTNKRKDYARWLVETGRLRGYMAYDGGQVIGWVNANQKKLITRWNDGKAENDKILSIACFIVQKEHRGKGVATALLSRLTADAPQRGFETVEAYPKKGAQSEYGRWNGPYEMYKKLGFVDGVVDGRKVVRKDLTGTGL